MKTLNYRQGSEEWLAARARYRTASEASVMMGVGPVTRSEMLRMKATGDEKEYSRWTLEVLFARGHEVEAQGRPLAEAIVGEELFPVTATDDDGYLLASFDGVTMDESIIWECKQWNDAKAAAVLSGEVPAADKWQVVQQLIVSGAEKCLYMVTDGTAYKTEHVWVYPDALDEDTLFSHWRLFDEDLKNYEHTEAAPVVVGRSPEALPALVVEVSGAVRASNLDAFRDHAMAVFAGINTQLSTDADFADAESTVKWCKSVEDKLAFAKEQALAQTASIDELFRAIDAISAEARNKRLELDKLVKSRKEAVRGEILAAAKASLQAHVAELNAGFAGVVTVPAPSVDFAGAMKGKRTISSLRDAADTEAARAKVEASQVASRMQACLVLVRAEPERAALFPDLQSLVMKAPDDLAAVIRSRISDADAAEAKRAAAKAEAEAAELRRVEELRLAAEARAAAPVPVAPAPAVVTGAAGSGSVAPAVPAPAPIAARAAPTALELVDLVAGYYEVTRSVAACWLSLYDFSRLEVRDAS